jgi:hypothetical protein
MGKARPMYSPPGLSRRAASAAYSLTPRWIDGAKAGVFEQVVETAVPLPIQRKNILFQDFDLSIRVVQLAHRSSRLGRKVNGRYRKAVPGKQAGVVAVTGT